MAEHKDTTTPTHRGEFDCCALERPPRGYTVVNIREHMYGFVHEETRKQFDFNIAPKNKFVRILGYNNECAFFVCSVSPTNIHKSRYLGFSVFLLLNELGLEQVQQGALDTSAPPVHCLARPDETAAALYWWVNVVPSQMARFLPMVATELSGERYSHLNIYAKAGTVDGAKTLERLGFYQLGGDTTINVGDYAQYTRLRNRGLFRPKAGRARAQDYAFQEVA